jgi:signal transduction histidine kinase
MDAIRAFFELNRTLVLAVYGQVFFVLGMAILFQTLHYSRLELARSLHWLALFGILHSFYEWGLIAIPLQSAYLARPVMDLLVALQSVILALSFTALFQFGVETLLGRRAAWQRFLPLGLWSLWMGAFIFPGFAITLGATPDDGTARAIARYGIGLPGAIVSAWALYRHSREQVAALRMPAFVRSTRVASASLLVYGLLAGLIPRPAPFWPASVLNSDLVEQFLVAPMAVWRSLAAFVFAAAIIRTLAVFEIEVDHMISRMEETQILAAERERLARELHDGAIQALYGAGMIAESVQRKLDPSSREAGQQQQVTQMVHQAIGTLRQTITDLRTPETADLGGALARLVQGYMLPVSLDVDLPAGRGLAPRRASHVLSVAEEAMSNCLRHSHAREIRLGARYDASNDCVHLWIEDDGNGIKANSPRGFGLRNMHDRARLLGGTLTVSAVEPHGTRVSLLAPWEDSSA